MSRDLLIFAAALAAALASSFSLPARGDEAADTARAQALFGEGRTALERGDNATACARFTQSLQIVKRASTLLNLGECEAALGKLRASAKSWRDGIALLPPGDERLAVSQQRADAVAARIPRLVVVLPAATPAGARVEVDGAAIPAAELAAGVLLDPGRHTVALVLPGGGGQSSTIDLAERESRTVTLSATATTSTPEPPQTPPPGGTQGMSTLRKTGFALLGVGVAGGVVAGVTGALLLSRNASINTDCPVTNGVHTCTPEGRSLINGVGGLNVANGIGWGVGLAGVASGVVLIVVGGKSSAPAPAEKPAITVAPTGLPGGGGMWMTARF